MYDFIYTKKTKKYEKNRIFINFLYLYEIIHTNIKYTMANNLELIKMMVDSGRGSTQIAKDIYNLMVNDKADMLEDLRGKMCTLDSKKYAAVTYAQRYQPGSTYHSAFVDGEMQIYNTVDGFLFEQIEIQKEKWVR